MYTNTNMRWRDPISSLAIRISLLDPPVDGGFPVTGVAGGPIALRVLPASPNCLQTVIAPAVKTRFTILNNSLKLRDFFKMYER